MTHPSFFPSPSKQDLCSAFVGKSLHEVPLPSAILDISKVKQNCQLMLDAVSQLKLGFRAHVKTHKTTELTRLQVGEESKDVRLIVSTVIEAESLVPLMKDYQGRGAKVNILYGIPLGRSKVSRLAAIAKQLGPNTITAMIDNIDQLASIKQFKQEANTPICVFIKTDSGYHRAGLLPDSDPMIELVKAISQAENEDLCHLLGFYSHNSLSYGGDNPDDAMSMLKVEIDVCQQAATHYFKTNPSRTNPLVISVGASPTALSIQNILSSSATPSSAATHLLQTLNLHSQTFTLEIHAGVYPVLDLQQVAASSRKFSSALAAHQTQALTILTECLSTYPSRTSTPEALVSAGTLALGREPCKSYPGWGVLTSWNLSDRYSEDDSVDARSRVVVKRISQEHGVMGWEEDGEGEQRPLPVEVGDRVRLWINHACIASVGYGWYLVVDGEKDEVVDVWVRWRGW